MSDDAENAPFFGDEVVEHGEQGIGQKCQSAFCSCCLGIFLFPLSLYLLGWNEQNYVCGMRQIAYAEDNAKELSCDKSPSEGFYSFSCKFDTKSYSNFTPARFNDVDANFFGAPYSFSALAASQQAEMYQCIESKSERTEGSGKHKRTIITYSYQLGWASSKLSFNTNPLSGSLLSRARTECGESFSGSNPAWLSGINEGTNTRYADAVKAGKVTLNQDLLERVPVDADVTTADITSASPTSAQNGWKGLDENGHVVLSNCNIPATPDIGCLKLTYRRSSATVASVITHVGSGSSSDAEPTPASWLCSSAEYQTLYSGTTTMTKADVMEKENDSNSSRTWIFRIVGLLAAWVSVFCCLAPIAFAADVLGDCLSCIPCIGGFMEDVVETVVNFVLCIISCSIGCSCGLFVIAIMMVVMRPLWGIALLSIVVCLWCVSAFAWHQAPRKGQKSMEEGDDDEEE